MIEESAVTLDELLQRMMQETTEFVNFTDHDESSSLYDPTYTYSNDKYSCIYGFFWAHIVFNYLIFLSGIGAFVTRLLPLQYRWIHSWMGRIYILSMLWSTSTSLVINNTGLPLATLISFAAVMGGLSIGWIAIVLHKNQMNTAATKLVEERIRTKGVDPDCNLGEMLVSAKGEVANSKTFVQRFFSFKALHGVVFFTSWFNIAGRIFSSNLHDFTCHTYPVYKPINTREFQGAENNLTLVPVNDPDYDRLPWSNGVVQWSMAIILGSFFGAAAVGAIWCFVAARRARRAEASSEQSSLRKSEALTRRDSGEVSDSRNSSDGAPMVAVETGMEVHDVGAENSTSSDSV